MLGEVNLSTCSVETDGVDAGTVESGAGWGGGSGELVTSVVVLLQWLLGWLDVFVRRDSVIKPLQPPYDGPFRVIHGTPN